MFFNSVSKFRKFSQDKTPNWKKCEYHGCANFTIGSSTEDCANLSIIKRFESKTWGQLCEFIVKSAFLVLSA